MSRQEELADAAIRVLGRRGLRQLTHRAVDAEAALPAGSTSNRYRTRDALLRAVVERLAVLDRADWAQLAPPGGPSASPGGSRPVAGLVPALVDFVRLALADGRDRTMARYALSLEAAVNPELAAELARGSAEIRSWATPWLRAAGSTDPDLHCRLMLDYLDGVLLHQLAYRDPDFDPRPGIETILRALLTR
ncbi:TetR/AcrR family transcriptional regulator [Solwaraspora sp. WMMD1047]|uniref:TetR/AcrR family transcriptional regulator n=1 Tax=Solwaraspora sp. WMMD1047 TaxID=3016102 RepID=UPI002415F5D6|nr:TetR/AcrR family transcriptional regulator [Solwaraspora sp. WMMD1047]MDG4832483.1 TetR/AcrR family transcriptional regulator [Solwaraspora sp. WMMD1047]